MKTIKEVAHQFNVTYDALRYYEKEGLLAPIQRDAQGRREYSTADLDALSKIVHLRALGASIADIKAFSVLFQQADITPESYDTGIAFLQDLDHQLGQRIAAIALQKDFLTKKIARLQAEKARLSSTSEQTD